MVKEDYCSFELTKLLKEKGFDQISDWGYREDGTCVEMIDYPITPPAYWGATLQIVMKWLREMYNLHILSVPYPHEDGVFYWAYKIAFLDSDTLAVMVTKQAAGFDTYEQACEAAIKYCLTELFN